jgi:hypothetical protein
MEGENMSNQDERNQAERILDHTEAMVQATVSKMLATARTTSFATTTGDTATTVTGSDGFTYSPNQKWLVDFPQGKGAPGLLDKRLA